MLKFILKRLLNLIPTIFFASLIIFAIIQAMPGDPVSAYLGLNANVPDEVRAQIATQLGLDGSFFEQYFRWIGRLLSGNLGRSITMRQPVADVIGPMISNTFLLNLVAFIIASIFALLVGIRQAVKKGKFTDNIWTVVSLFGISIPSFFFAFILIFFVALPTGLPLSGMRDPMRAILGYANWFESASDVARHMIMPVTVLAFGNFAVLSRYVRNAMIDVLNQDYIRTARSKGLKEKIVIYRHGFKNALIPLVTLLGLYIPSLFSGAVILESIFQWPGIGRGLITAINNRDQSIALACMLFLSVLAMLGNLLSDLLYSLVDPRIKTK